jgi:hypothetical protein
MGLEEISQAVIARKDPFPEGMLFSLDRAF